MYYNQLQQQTHKGSFQKKKFPLKVPYRRSSLNKIKMINSSDKTVH